MRNDYTRKAMALMQWTTRAPAEHKALVMGEAATLIIVRTPEKTGQAKSNWNMAIDAPDLTTRSTEGLGGAAAIARARATISQFKLGQKVYFTNSLAYIRGLELGRSDQAPAGMVTITLAELGLIFQRTFKTAFGEVKRG